MDYTQWYTLIDRAIGYWNDRLYTLGHPPGIRCSGMHCKEDLAGGEGGGFAQVGPVFVFGEASSHGSCFGVGAEAGGGFSIGGFACKTWIGNSLTFQEGLNMLGGAKLAFSYEKICQDIAGLVVLLSIAIWILVWDKFSLRPLVGIPAFVISEFILGVAGFQLTYRRLWPSVDSRFHGRLRRRSTDQALEAPIESYAGLISSWKNHRTE